MVATRGKKEETKAVFVQFSGPKSLVSRNVVFEVQESQTWLEILTQNLHIQDAERKGLFICTTKYCASDPKPGGGWRCDLHDTVSSFVERFARKITQYAVRICDPSDASRVAKYRSLGREKSCLSLKISPPAKRTKCNKRNKKRTGTKSRPKTDSLSSSQMNNGQPTTEEVVTQLTSKEIVTDSIPSVKELPGLVVFKREPDGSEGIMAEQDVNSVKKYCWAFTAEPVEVLQYGCDRKNLKDIAARRLTGLCCIFVHRVEHDLAYLVEEGYWTQLKELAPSLCRFVEELTE